MRKSRFTDEQVLAILREADCSSVADVARKHKISGQNIYEWRKQSANWRADLRRLRALESENFKLKRLLAERDFDIRALHEVNRQTVAEFRMLMQEKKCHGP